MSHADPVVAIIGKPLGHSLSPEMHNAAFAALQLSWSYVALEIEPDQVSNLVTSLKASNVAGLNVTMPYKSVVMSSLDEIDELARHCGAVNTIRFESGRASGFNTDAVGFLRSLRQETSLDPSGCQVLMLGAGGVARAVAVALASAGAASISVWGRDEQKISNFVSDLKSAYPNVEWTKTTGQGLRELAANAGLIVNATPIGMYPDDNAAPLPIEWITSSQTVADLIYRPAKTTLIKEAENIGCVVLPGVGTFLHQAAEAFSIWTGMPAPLDTMQEVLSRKLGYIPRPPGV